MKTKKTTRRALALSALALLLCMSMLVGTTFAWFTDSVTSANNIIKSGTLDVTMEWLDGTGAVAAADSDEWKDASQIAIFDYDLWEPGYTQVRHIKIANKGTLALKYQISIAANGTVSDLAKVIDVYYMDPAAQVKDRTELTENAKLGTLSEVLDNLSTTAAGSLKAGENHTITIALKMQEEAGNDYQNKSIGTDFSVKLLATQLTAETDSFDDQYDADAAYPVQTDTWDGTVDTSWYNDTDTEFVLTTAEQLAGLAELVDGDETFEGKTVKLGGDLDLYYVPDGATEPKCFEPIGSYRNDKEFKGTFDGQGHTISNLSQNTWALDNGYYYSDLGMGLFAAVRDAEIKNLFMDGASISGESGLCGAVAGTAYGKCTFDNITVQNSKVNDYQYYAGGVVGWASGDHVYKNINVDSSTVIGSQWGDFGNCNGGIIGGAGTSGTYHFEDCVIACRIDATNDVVSAYQWYNYRNSGMIIGKVGPETIENTCTTVTADNVTCKNVEVIFGDWSNYTYCEFAGTGYPYVRVQAGVSVDAYSNVRYGHPTDANGNTVVDDNHVHNDGEAHHKLIEFRYLFGGPANARYCYYGIKEHPGVTVILPNP